MTQEKIQINIEFDGKNYHGWAKPQESSPQPNKFAVILDNRPWGYLWYSGNKWESEPMHKPALTKAIGDYIHCWYE